MLKEYLEKAYGYNEPIFISEIQLEGISDNALQAILQENGFSRGYYSVCTGVYYLPNASRILKKSYLDPMKVIIRKYIKNAGETYGYFSGATFANQIGLTTQMPTVLEIVTSRESTKGRIVTVGSQKVRLKRPSIEITSENAGLLQLLDIVSQANLYSEYPEQKMGEILKRYVRNQRYTRESLMNSLPAITVTTAKNLLNGELFMNLDLDR